MFPRDLLPNIACGMVAGGGGEGGAIFSSDNF